MIDLQQTAARQRDRAVVALNEFIGVEPFVDWLKLVPNIDAEFGAEVLDVKRASFKLQDHLADKLLFWCQCQTLATAAVALVRAAPYSSKL